MKPEPCSVVFPQGTMPRFNASGSGRDCFQGDKPAPSTGKLFNKFISPSGTGPPMPSKGFHYSTGIRAGYNPNGTGRDLQLFCVDASSAPATGYQFSAKPPSIKRSQQPVPACRSEPPTKTRPNGSGRDLFQIAMGGPRTIPRTSVVFSEIGPSQKGPACEPRTSPPPRYTPSGSGRDGFQRVGEKNGPDPSDSPDAFGFGPPRWDPAALHRPKTTGLRAGQMARAETLSRPRTASVPDGGGLLVPGSNLRKFK